MTRILVTGARGLLGSHLVPHLLASGHEVTKQARNGDAELLADLSNAEQARAALDEAAPEVIVNLAALTNVDACERNPQEAYLANVRIVENLAGWMRRTSGCHLVHISTDQVYDGDGLHDEGNITLTNYYGFSKYAGELAAGGVPSTVLRTNFFGPSKCAGRVSLSDWLVRSLSAGESIAVFDDVRFSPLSFHSVVDVVERAVVARKQGVFNVGSRDGMSKADFAFAFAQALGLPVRAMRRDTAANAGMPAYRPKDMRMDSSRFENAFGVRLPTLQEEIQSTRAAYAHASR